MSEQKEAAQVPEESLKGVSGGLIFNSKKEWVCPEGHYRKAWTPPSPSQFDSPQPAPLCPTCQKQMKLQ